MLLLLIKMSTLNIYLLIFIKINNLDKYLFMYHAWSKHPILKYEKTTFSGFRPP